MNKLQRLAALITVTMMSFQLISVPAFAAADEADTGADTATTDEVVVDEDEVFVDENEVVDENEDEVDEPESELAQNFEEIEIDDAVDVLDDLLIEEEEISDEEIEMIVDEVMEDVDTSDEAEAVLETVEADVQNIITDLEVELQNTDNIAKRLRLTRRILRHKSFLFRLRVRIIHRFTKLADAVSRSDAVRQLYIVRWGVLSGSPEERCNLTREEIKAAYDADEKPDCGVAKVDYEGRLSVDKGELEVIKTILFENNDVLTDKSGPVIDWTSRIAGHWDGLLVKYTPDSDNDEEVNVTIELGDVNETFVGSDIIERRDLGNGHFLEIRPVVSALATLTDVNVDRLMSNKLRLQNVLEKMRERLRRVRLLTQDAATDLGDEVDDIEDELEDVEDYNFDDSSTTEVEEAIDDMLENFSDGIDRTDIRSRAKDLRNELKRIRSAAKDRKFAQRLIPFRDTDDDQWYTKYVAPMKQRGVVSGYKDSAGNELGEYRPGNLVTVAELFKIGLEIAQKGGAEGNPDLVKARTHWAKAYVKRAEELGLDLIKPDLDLSRNATRGEVVRMMLEALGIEAEDVFTTSFPDLSPNHKQAAYLQLAFELGIISGDDGTGNVRADDPINRAEVAKIANQVLNVLVGDDIE